MNSSLSSVSDLKKWTYEPVKVNPEVLRNKDLVNFDHCVPTKNQKGNAYSKLGEAVDIWASSLTESRSPLLDLGAAYGFQTIAALKKGRDVIAVDMEIEHLKALQNSVRHASEAMQQEGKNAMGNLIDTKSAVLPNGSLFPENQIAGILLSEVIQFCTPGEPFRLFKDAYKWLEPGGLFVVTGTSPCNAEFWLQFGAKLHHQRTMDEAWNILSTGTDDEIINSAATFVDLSTIHSDSLRESIGNHMYCISTNELCALARCSGFEIDRAEYILGDIYPVKSSKCDNGVLLVAKKPSV